MYKRNMLHWYAVACADEPAGGATGKFALNESIPLFAIYLAASTQWNQDLV